MYVPPSDTLKMYLWTPTQMNEYKDLVLSELGIIVEFKFRSKTEFEMYDMGTDVPMYMSIEGLPVSGLRRIAIQHYVGAYLVMSSMKVSSYSIRKDMIAFRRSKVWQKVSYGRVNGYTEYTMKDSYWGSAFGVWSQVKGHFWGTVLRCMR